MIALTVLLGAAIAVFVVRVINAWQDLGKPKRKRRKL